MLWAQSSVTLSGKLYYINQINENFVITFNYILFNSIGPYSLKKISGPLSWKRLGFIFSVISHLYEVSFTRFG